MNINVNTQGDFPSQQNRYVCIYAYYEKNDLYRNNFLYFLHNGILPEVDYYIIINGATSLNIQPKSNIKVIQRPNKGYDFGAWADCVNNYLTQKYDYYIFINSSVYGPLKKDWLPSFLELFDSPDTKLVGVTVNIFLDKKYQYQHTKKHEPNFADHYNRLKTMYGHEGPFTHVQSYFFILEKDGLEYVKSRGLFDEQSIDACGFQQLIDLKEIGMSQMILQNNWNINSILSKYRGYDYRTVEDNFNFSSASGDPFFNGHYFGQTISPMDAIFYKNNRQNILCYNHPDNPLNKKQLSWSLF